MNFELSTQLVGSVFGTSNINPWNQPAKKSRLVKVARVFFFWHDLTLKLPVNHNLNTTGY